MDKNLLWRIVRVSLYLFIFGIIMLALGSTVVSTTTEDEKSLATLHNEEIRLELDLQQAKTERADLQRQLDIKEKAIILLRTRRAEIHEERNAIINASTYKESPSGEASFDLDKLAYAVAMAETQNCTTGCGISKNNCFGIMTWDRGFRECKAFDTPEDSYADFKRIWSSYYSGGYPTWNDHLKWVGYDSPNWRANVHHYFYE